MIIVMKKGSQIVTIGHNVRKLIEAGYEMEDILINKNNGKALIAVLGQSGERLAKGMDSLLREKFVLIETIRDDSLFHQTNGGGFEEAWNVI